MYQAVTLLQPSERDSLSDIVKITGPKVFKGQNMNEVQEAVKHSIFLAVAAATHTQVRAMSVQNGAWKYRCQVFLVTDLLLLLVFRPII